MQWLVSLGLLVAVLGRLLTLHHHLHHLHSELEQAWALWVRQARRRNACLLAFLQSLEEKGCRGLRPPAEDLAALAERSDRRLSAAEAQAEASVLHADELSREEAMLSHAIREAISGLQNSDDLPGHDGLPDDCAQLCLAMQLAEQSALLYNGCADTYNEALRGPTARLAAPALRFFPAQRL